jgi:predicted O-linked N-acetylglucosamine transferase (SPINDLY family)
MGQAHNNLGNALKDVGQIDRSIACYEKAVAWNANDAVSASNRIFSLNYHPGFDRAALLREQRQWNQKYAMPLARLMEPHGNDRSPDRRLRIGYVSPDFRNHAAGQNLWPLLEHRDRGGFEVFGYHNDLRSDDHTEMYRSACDGWRSIAAMDDDKTARMIREDKIDILLDLSQHMGGNRLLVFARKPAPVQISFIGYPGSTGMDAIDCRLTDQYLDPPGETDGFYHERSVRLPDSFWCYDPAVMESADLLVGDLPALANGFVTFGCLCNFCKVSDQSLQLWAAVMRETGDSRLLMMAPPGSARQRVVEQMGREGIEAHRLEFVSRQPRGDYLKTFQRIDLGLDTLPYNGHTTSLDSFWMGTAVVTLMGQTVVGRAGWSLVSNLNLKELAAQTPEEFSRIAVDLAKDTGRLSELRRGLRERMRTSPLCDGRRFVRNVEAVYRREWRRWCEGGDRNGQ